MPATRERWRDIPGWADGAAIKYQASTLGRIRSIRRLKSGRVKICILRPGFKGGYQQVVLRSGGKSATRQVHSLVALTFHGPRPTPGHSVDHDNRLPYDNRAGNLKYATRREQEANKNPVGWLRIYDGFPGVVKVAGGFRASCFLGRREWRPGCTDLPMHAALRGRGSRALCRRRLERDL